MGVCSNCGHTPEARCSKCLRSFSCGSMGVRCPEPDCNEGILDHSVDAEYATWLAAYYQEHGREPSKHLEDPHLDGYYQLRSEVHPE